MLGVDGSKFSATERRLFDVLSDGAPHTIAELLSYIPDDMSRKSLTIHIVNIRKKIPSCLVISHVSPNGRRAKCYQMFRKLQRE